MIRLLPRYSTWRKNDDFENLIFFFRILIINHNNYNDNNTNKKT